MKHLAIQKTVMPDKRVDINRWYADIHLQVKKLTLPAPKKKQHLTK